MTVFDRKEGDTAFLETDSGIIGISADELPSDASEGDILIKIDGAWLVDREATEKRRRRIRNKLKRLMKNRND
ncbi:MAG: DUF3006 domain-containing protein [Ruminococcus sp.]|nr:DUF3006 domain-containing protein [Ruminococcus sp.]